MRRTRIIGTGSYLPERVVRNGDVGAALGIDSGRVLQLTGIAERRWITDFQATSDLAVEAAHAALTAAGLVPSSIDAILVSTTSPDMPFPSTACHVQRKLGCPGVPAFDLAASCSGFLYGLSMADAMIRSGQVSHCLVVGAEVKSRMLDQADTDTALLFGDGAGAVVVRGEDVQGVRDRGLLGVRLYADGARHSLIRIPAGGSRLSATSETLAAKQHSMRMTGAPLFRLAVRKVERAIRDILKEFGVGLEQISQVILHQANGRILNQLTTRLGLPASSVCSVIERCGNTSSASLPIALDHAVRSGRIQTDDHVVLAGFGGGLTWAAGLIRW
jgi:3-oxoacyl-[acyl-carrier-protein] synthase-3